MYKHCFKRVIDVVLSGMALLCLSPVLLVVTIWLYVANRKASPQPSPEGKASPQPSPEGEGAERKSHPSGGDLEGASGFWSTIFFTQERPGKNAKIFKVIKFKTMTDTRDASGKLLPDEDRLTKVGAFVRSTSIDELPQLINVFKGDMALIGPRPLLVRYLPWYTEEEQHRHDIRPGISGWAQANGRNAVTWDEKLAMDIWYVNNVSFVTDIKVILKTIKSVLLRESVEVAGVEALDTCRMKEGKTANNV